jgi:hypothetical protein
LKIDRYENLYPKSDAAAYVKDYGLHVPFLEELFMEPNTSAVSSSSSSFVFPSLHQDSTMLTAIAQPSIIHRFSKKANIAPRLLEEDSRLASTAINIPNKRKKRKTKN